jgi:hypothetical protein
MVDNRCGYQFIYTQRGWLNLKLKPDGGIMYKQILKNAKLKIGKRGQKTELNGEVH